MAPIVTRTEISRPPEDVFAYVTDPRRLPEWQASVVSAEPAGSSETPIRLGAKFRVTRRIRGRDMKGTVEFAELTPPTRWAVHSLDGAVRGDAKGTIESLEDGARSRVTIELDLHGHGIGKLLLPLFIRRMAAHEMPRNMEKLKERLESSA
jgi:carbon monoxide dehydrogenase subunit G